jgi:hypothetical protein
MEIEVKKRSANTAVGKGRLSGFPWGVRKHFLYDNITERRKNGFPAHWRRSPGRNAEGINENRGGGHVGWRDRKTMGEDSFPALGGKNGPAWRRAAGFCPIGKGKWRDRDSQGNDRRRGSWFRWLWIT